VTKSVAEDWGGAEAAAGAGTGASVAGRGASAASGTAGTAGCAGKGGATAVAAEEEVAKVGKRVGTGAGIGGLGFAIMSTKKVLFLDIA